MNLKKLLLAAGGSFLTMFILSYVWHKLLMNSLYMPEGTMESACNRAEPLVPIIALAYAILACLMSYIYPKGVEGDNKLMNGLRFGAMMGLVWVLPMSLVMHAVSTTAPLSTAAIDAGWHLVEQGVGGIIIAYVYGMKD